MLSVGAGRLFSIMSDAVLAEAGLPAALQARTCALFIPKKPEFNHKVPAEHAGAYRIMAGAMLLEGTHSPPRRRWGPPFRSIELPYF